MPMHTNWDNEEQSIVRIESEGQWTWDEYHTSIDKMAALIKKVNHRVDVIIVDSPGATMPKGSPMLHFDRAVKIQPSNTGFYVVVTTNAVARALVSLYAKLPGRRIYNNFRMVASLEDAYAVIKASRATALEN